MFKNYDLLISSVIHPSLNFIFQFHVWEFKKGEINIVVLKIMRIYVTQHLVILNIIVTDNIFYPFCYSAAAESGDQQSSEQEEDRGEGRGIPSFGMCGAICETCGHDYVVSWKHSDQRGRNVDYTDFHRGW